MVKNISKFIFRITCIVLLITFIQVDAEAQKRRKKTKKKETADKNYEPAMSLRERIYVGTYLNTPSIFGSNTGSQFGVGLQPFAAYKFNEYFSSGVAIKFDYLYINTSGFAQQFTDFSTTVFTRALLAEQIILQIEGGLYSDHRAINFNEKERVLFPIALVGAGYSFGNSEIILAYELTGNFFRNGIFPFEYKFGFIFDF